MPRFGARVNQHKDGTIQVVQTVKKGETHNSPYVCDHVKKKNKEKFVRVGDDTALIKAIKDALSGNLTPTGKAS